MSAHKMLLRVAKITKAIPRFLNLKTKFYTNKSKLSHVVWFSLQKAIKCTKLWQKYAPNLTFSACNLQVFFLGGSTAHLPDTAPVRIVILSLYTPPFCHLQHVTPRAFSTWPIHPPPPANTSRYVNGHKREGSQKNHQWNKTSTIDSNEASTTITVIHEITTKLDNYSINQCKTYTSLFRYGTVSSKTSKLLSLCSIQLSIQHSISSYVAKYLLQFCAYLGAIFLPTVGMPLQFLPEQHNNSTNYYTVLHSTWYHVIQTSLRWQLQYIVW